MKLSTRPVSDVWAITDIAGRIEAVSSSARAILRIAHLDRGDSLLHFFPLHQKAVVFDIEVALAGWPTERTLTVKTPLASPMTVHYRVSRRSVPDSDGLFWQLAVAVDHTDQRCA